MMESHSKSGGRPPPYEAVLEPAVVVLSGDFIYNEIAASAPLYHLGRSIDSITYKDTSIPFEGVDMDGKHNREDADSAEPKYRRLFNLVHPLHAEHRTDVPACYFMTCSSPDLLGNIRVETSKSFLRKTEFKALRSANKTASSNPLFDDQTQEVLFTGKQKMGGGYVWTDSHGREVAREGGKGDKHKLAITVPLTKGNRDALIALWILRLWHGIIENPKFKRKVLEELAPPSRAAYVNMKHMKRAGGLAGLAASGGAC